MQLFVDLFDLIPTGAKYINREKHLGPEVVSKTQDHAQFCQVDSYLDYLDDIEQNGIQVALKIHPSGEIADGNLRYWCLRALWDKTHNPKWRRVPIDLWYYMGMGLMFAQGISFRRDLISKIPRSIFENHPAYSPRKSPPKIDSSKLITGLNANVYVDEFDIFSYVPLCPKCMKPVTAKCPKCDVPIASRRPIQLKLEYGDDK